MVKTQTAQETFKFICCNCMNGYKQDWIIKKDIKKIICPKCKTIFIKKGSEIVEQSNKKYSIEGLYNRMAIKDKTDYNITKCLKELK